MICPNDESEMHHVKIVAHYGQPIIVDQCQRCGGIWFDEAELFRAKQGEADRIEMLDADIIRAPSMIEKSELLCPRDRAVMLQFVDRYFPQDIILVYCRSCRGIWLNRGGFTKYQRFRQGLLQRSQQRSAADKRRAEIKKLVQSYESGRTTETLRKLGEFLSTPIDRGALTRLGAALRIIDFIAD
jgi:Zn-finger nucleic acid-binding protein